MRWCVQTNDAPTAVAQAGLTQENEILSVLSPGVLDGAADPDQGETDQLVVHEFGNPAVAAGDQYNFTNGGTLVISSNGSYVFDPKTAYDYLAVGDTAVETIEFTVWDPHQAAGTANLVITINGVSVCGGYRLSLAMQQLCADMFALVCADQRCSCR